MPWLRCPFWAETSHENLGYLAPEDGETTRKVEVCDTCKGYVKAEPTVSELPWWGVLLYDVATVALDVAALDRGYHRPERPGFDMELKVSEATHLTYIPSAAPTLPPSTWTLHHCGKLAI